MDSRIGLFAVGVAALLAGCVPQMSHEVGVDSAPPPPPPPPAVSSGIPRDGPTAAPDHGGIDKGPGDYGEATGSAAPIIIGGSPPGRRPPAGAPAAGGPPSGGAVYCEAVRSML